MRKFYSSSFCFRLLFAGILSLLIGSVNAQIKIGTNGANIDRASLLELESQTQGFLLPRMIDTVAINALNPPNGMLIYLLKSPAVGLYVRKVTGWEFLTGSLGGNGNFNSLTVSGAVTAGSFSGPLTGNATSATNVTGVVAAVNGGTGHPAYNPGDLLYASSPSNLARLPVGAATQILKGGATSPVWGSVNLSTDVGTSVVAPLNGGTGIANTNTLTLSGANISLTATGSTNVTLPTTGTLATLAGFEPLTNKTINGNTITAGSGTLTLAAGSTLATAGANPITFTSTPGGSSVTVPSTGVLATRAGLENLTNKTINGNTITPGSGTLTLATGSALTTTNGSITLNSANPSNVTLPTSGVLAAVITRVASVSFPSTPNAQSSNGLSTISVPGAVDGDAVSLGIPNLSMSPGYSYTAWVSGQDEVTVRFTNTSGGSATLPPINFTVKIIK